MPPSPPRKVPLCRRLTGFGTTIFTEISALAAKHGAVNLGQGFPDFDGPEFVKRAAITAIEAGHGQYARMTGISPLHEALHDKYARDWDLDYPVDSAFTVTSGATETLFAALQGLVDTGDEVILFQPYYDSYRAGILNAGGIPRVVTLRAPDWSLDADELRRAFGPRTKAILVNTPHNPTGKVYSRDELELVAELCHQHDVYCISDEVYEHLVFDGAHVPIATLPGMYDRTITISSLGKTFSLTGWKIGWAAAPPALGACVRAAHQFITFATATPLQHGAVAALRAPPSYYAELLATYRAKRDRLAEGLAAVGFDVRPPAGTYFLCGGIAKWGMDDVSFARHMVENVGVAVIPPSVFYDDPRLGSGYVRFAFCKKDDTIDETLRRVRALA
jgi:N-succinyldiaminopimelate aminotransferase